MNVPMVQNNPEYLKIQANVISHYIENRHEYGDNRTDNEIVIEWIQYNAKKFREDWISTGGNLG
jgi:hypothetical protein